MGAGGQKTFPRSEEEEKQQQAAAAGFKRIPTTKPPFTLSDLRKAIPPHCFQRSLLRSFSYVFIDLTIISILGYIATTYIYLLSPPSKYLAWLLYWAVQGCFFTGAWALAHDCGHHAFSDYQWVDDAVGMVLHSTLMVPYFSFKYSHRRHHSNINSLERDEVFVPRPKSEIKWYCSKYLNNPLGRVLTLAVTLILGWPMYLAFNASGRDYDRFVSHFYPYGPIYNDRERLQIYISDAGIFIVSYVLYQVALAKGLPWLICIYSVPLFVNNALVVTITYLQHTHPELPRYSNSEWDWFKGTLATVDRDMGPLLNWVTHHVSDTHYVHHLFSTMPHYHGVEATKAVKLMLGEYYRFDPTPLHKALWREAKECLFVESDSKSPGVFWFHKF